MIIIFMINDNSASNSNNTNINNSTNKTNGPPVVFCAPALFDPARLANVGVDSELSKSSCII